LALTGSRAGTVCALLGAVVFFLALAINHRWSAKKGALLAGVLFVLFVLFVAIGGESLLLRLEDQKVGEDSATRLAAYALAQQSIADNPWLGFGLGSFESAFRLYRDDTLPLWFHHAHNDYIEMAMDLGLPAFSLLLFSFLLLVSCCAQGVWLRRRSAVYPSIGLAATFLVAAHVSVDFSLHIPAIAATYAALLGLGVAQSFSSREHAAEKKTLAEPASPRRSVAPPVQAQTPTQPSPPQNSGNGRGHGNKKRRVKAR
jgi:O-antigen ligase